MRISRWVAAAAVITVVVTGAYLYLNRPDESGKAAAVIPADDIKAPVTNRATITLADGSVIYIDSAQNGSLAAISNVEIIKQADGKISYRLQGKAPAPLERTGGEVYNTLTNPRGSKVIDMALSDGSHVWLNAGSSVKFPVAFIGSERRVVVTGEAYFEVKKQKAQGKNGNIPFFVEANGVVTEVLGTHFNVGAYQDEGDVKVTLLEGSVKVSTSKSLSASTPQSLNTSTVLKPGEQAVVKGSSPMHTDRAPDLEKIMAWKNNEFNFSDDDLPSIMRQLARWYNIRPVITGTSTLNYTGRITRDVALRKVLEMFEKIGYVKFEIRGDEVKVIAK